MGDEVWVLYEFATKQDREAWESNLPQSVRDRLDRELIPDALTFGWFTRDMNGFCV